MGLRHYRCSGRDASHSECALCIPVVPRRSKSSFTHDVFCLSLAFGLSFAPRHEAYGGTRPDGEGSLRGARALMVEKQLQLRGIKDERVLAAMQKVERERFVPEEMKPHAYDDRALPIGYGQSISQPYIVALMTELLELQGNEKVLEVGTGSGYQAAILGELVKEVYSIEIVPELAEEAAGLLKELGYKNVHTRQGDG